MSAPEIIVDSFAAAQGLWDWELSAFAVAAAALGLQPVQGDLRL